MTGKYAVVGSERGLFMRFSERTSWEETDSAWSLALENARTGGRALADLTVSNPTVCGLGLAPGMAVQPLADPDAARYTPDPLGMRVAREAVSAYYGEQGAAVSPDRLCLTTSTSEGYSFLFRLLCDPGDEVLVARPSYPLFDLLARLESVVLREYPLHYEQHGTRPQEGEWAVDLETLEARITPRTRALVAVHPNNPTGNYVQEADRQALQRICARHRLALLVDEVFLDYGVEQRPACSFACDDPPCLCFVLSGLSKVCALPQMKVSWMAALGPEALVSAAMLRLEVVADTFLSLNAPVQHALRSWLKIREPVQAAIRERVRANLAALDARLQGSLGDRLRVGGGWTAVLRVPRWVESREFALAALDAGVVAQPGELYGLPGGRCVVSLLTSPEAWAAGLARLPL